MFSKGFQLFANYVSYNSLILNVIFFQIKPSLKRYKGSHRMPHTSLQIMRGFSFYNEYSQTQQLISNNEWVEKYK